MSWAHPTARFAAPASRALIVVSALLLSTACDRETRIARVQPPLTDVADMLALTDLRAGPMEVPPDEIEPSERSGETAAFEENQYDRNAFLISEGKKLYMNFNCVGCHANGGGGMGPPLMDDEWIYGHRPEQIYASIVQGRPEGMPTFRGRLNVHQVWQLVAYVRSLGGLIDSDAAPGRPDGLKGREPEHSLPRQDP